MNKVVLIMQCSEQSYYQGNLKRFDKDKIIRQLTTIHLIFVEVNLI